MEECYLDFGVAKLGECRIPSPMSGVHFVDTDEPVLYHPNLRSIEACLEAGGSRPASR